MTNNGSETRWTLPSSPTPPIAISYSTGWSDTSNAFRLLTAPRETGLYPTLNGSYVVQGTGQGTMTNYNMLMVQYQTQPLPYNVFLGSGTLFNLAVNLFTVGGGTGGGSTRLAFAFYIYRSTGTKAGLLSGGAETVGNTATVINTTTPTTCTAAVPLTGANLFAGDILVCELGFSISNTSGSTVYGLSLGRPSKTTDMAQTAGAQTGIGDPWFGLSYDLYAHNQLTARTVRTRPRLFAPRVAR